jgi:hypothetical protein
MKDIYHPLKSAIMVMLIIVATPAATVLAQANYLEREAAHMISNKAEQGYLGNVETDDTAKEIRLFFVTATKAKKIKVEKYVFDYDLNLKSNDKEEYEYPKDVKSKYNWFKFRNQEIETVTGVTVEPNMMGTLVFKKKEITKYWSWFNGGYRTEVKTTDKLKPKNEDGKKYFYRAHFDNDETGEVLAFVSIKYGGKEYNKMNQEFAVLRVNKDLDVVSTTPVNFPHEQWMIFNGRFTREDDDSYNGDYVVILAPHDLMGVKDPDPNPTTYTYLRISPEGKVVEQVPFTTKSTRWQIEGVYEKNGVTTIYGAGFKIGKPKDAYANFKNYAPNAVNKGFDNFQIVSIKDGKVQFVSTPNLDEMESKTVAPAGQKKAQAYEGGRLRVTGIETAANGDALIMAQMLNKNIASQLVVYKDFMVLHFGGNGDLKKVYSIDTPAKGGMYNATDPVSSPATRPSFSDIYMGGEGKYAYWVTGLVTKVDKSTVSYYFLNQKTTTWTPREQLLVGRIDLENNKMDEIQTAGDGVKGKKDFFLRRDIRYAPYNNGKGLLVIGEDRTSLGVFSKNDNYIYLGLIDLSKR